MQQTETTPAQAALTTVTIPRIGIEWPAQGGIYAGIVRGENGSPDHHLILLPGEAESVSLQSAKEWAEQNGGELPTRREQALLFANLKEEFKPEWYWSSEQHASYSDYAWYQYFDDGFQFNDHKSCEGRARAVRRLIIQ